VTLVSHLSRSLKVIRTDTDQSVTIATMGLSYTVSEIKGNFSQKMQFFPTPRVFNAPTEGCRLELHNTRWPLSKKLE